MHNGEEVLWVYIVRQKRSIVLLSSFIIIEGSFCGVMVYILMVKDTKCINYV